MITPIVLSIKVLCVCILLFATLALPFAYILSKKFYCKYLLEAFVTLPLIFPPIATGFLLLLALGKNSFLGSWLASLGVHIVFSFWGLALAGFIAGVPLLIKPVQSAIENFPKSIKEASFICGKSEFYTLFFVILPSIKKSVLAALIIASGRALGEVGITLMLGGNIIGQTDTLSLAIYNAVFDGEYHIAMNYSFILIGISIAFFTILHFLEERREKYV